MIKIEFRKRVMDEAVAAQPRPQRSRHGLGIESDFEMFFFSLLSCSEFFASSAALHLGPNYSWSEEKSQHCVSRGASLEQRTHRREALITSVVLGTAMAFLQGPASNIQFAGQSKAQAYYPRSGGLAPRLASSTNKQAGVKLYRVFLTARRSLAAAMGVGFFASGWRVMPSSSQRWNKLTSISN